MKDGAFITLGIETSCDESAIAVTADGRKLLSNVISSQIDIHTKFGGVVPEIASRHHLENINAVLDQALDDAGMRLSDVDLIGNENAIYIVVQGDEGELLGYLSVWCVADEGQIMTVAVMPEHRRKHVASVLMHAMLKVTEERGVKSHTLELRKSNEAALGLYEKFGFQVAGIRPGYYEDDGEDALIMWRIGDPSKPGKES